MKYCCVMWYIPRATKESDFALFLAYVATLKVPGSLPWFLGMLQFCGGVCDSSFDCAGTLTSTDQSAGTDSAQDGSTG